MFVRMTDNNSFQDKKEEEAGSIKSNRSIFGRDSGAPKRSLTSLLVQLLLIDED